jgi:hypothetical protein
MLRKIKIGQSAGLKSDGINDQVNFPFISALDFTGSTPFSMSVVFQNDFTIRTHLYDIVSLLPVININNGFLLRSQFSGGVPFLYVYIGDLSGVQNVDYIVENIILTEEEYFLELKVLLTFNGFNQWSFRVNNHVINFVGTISLITAKLLILNRAFADLFKGIYKSLIFWGRELNLTERNNVILGIYPNDFTFNLPFNDTQGFKCKDSVSGIEGDLINYSNSDVTPGATNSWLYSNGKPFDNLQYAIIK